ncbi:CvpA family protein [Pedobacter sp. P351]|uniref:CAP domain-containing protein n=1 Tax=Pedobacter superstes TaxID=3133441 RepID=UPI0030A8C50F
MNYIDLLLLIIIALSIRSGIQKGFILGMVELICWLGSLLLTFFVYPYIVSFLDTQRIASGFWALGLTFLLTLFAIRFALSYLSEWFLVSITPDLHTNKLNRVSGMIPGLLSGVIYAALSAALILLLPVSEKLTQEARESKIASGLSSSVEKAEAAFSPVLNNVSRSITKITIPPGSEKFIQLGFRVKNPKPRTDLETKMLIMVNQERLKAGLPPLNADPEIAKVARRHSNDMFARGYFSHISPEGATPLDRIREANIRFLTAGENLALAQTLKMAHSGLMNSPGHKANILHKSFGRLGIGILDGGIHGLMVTQNFRN